MTSPVVIKGLVVAGGISLSGGIGIWKLNEYMTPKTIREKLMSQGETFYGLNEQDDKTGWTGLAKTYKENNGSANEDTRLNGVSITSQTPNEADGKTLKDACKALIDKNLSEENADKDLIRAQKWCVKPREDASTKDTNVVGS